MTRKIIKILKYATGENLDISHSYLGTIVETVLALVIVKSELIISNKPLNLTSYKKYVGQQTMTVFCLSSLVIVISNIMFTCD